MDIYYLIYYSIQILGIAIVILIPILIIGILLAILKIWKMSNKWLVNMGYALVLSLILFIVLWQSGMPPPRSPPVCTGFSQIKPIEWKAYNSDERIILTLKNDAGVRMRLDDISANINVGISRSSCSSHIPTLPLELDAGQSTQVELIGCSVLSNAPTGDYYWIVMDVSYTVFYNNLEYKRNSFGQCWGLIE